MLSSENQDFVNINAQILTASHHANSIACRDAEHNSTAQSLEIALSMLRDLQIRLRSLEDSNRQTANDFLALPEDLAFHLWAKTEYHERMMRRDTFEQSYIMGEPAWDILLDLCVAEIERRQVSVTSACIASGVPVTTALRWLALLEQDALIERKADPLDKRRTMVRISKKAFAQLFEHYRRIAAKRKSR